MLSDMKTIKPGEGIEAKGEHDANTSPQVLRGL